ncbi:hypothetical protein ACQ86N_42320 [Puia sp. P3]|uniref:hypothetical protein n=1 Tax=Puia sp. P3 TaxID=3423952 RepID=UPI003D66D0AD
MIKRSLSIVLVASLTILVSCNTKKKGTFTVTGTYRNADRLASMEGGPVNKVYLLEVAYGKDPAPILLDSAKLSPEKAPLR